MRNEAFFFGPRRLSGGQRAGVGQASPTMNTAVFDATKDYCTARARCFSGCPPPAFRNWVPISDIVLDHKALESLDRVAEHNPPVQRWLEFLTAYNETLECRNGSANEIRFSIPPTFACDGARSQWPQHSYSVLRRALLLHPLARPTFWWTLRRAGLSGLAPSDRNSGFGGLTPSPHDLQDFRQHGAPKEN